jgi:hypothetical protein
MIQMFDSKGTDHFIEVFSIEFLHRMILSKMLSIILRDYKCLIYEIIKIKKAYFSFIVLLLLFIYLSKMPLVINDRSNSSKHDCYSIFSNMKFKI